MKAGDSIYWDPKNGGSGYSRDNIFYFERNGKIMEWTRQGSHRPTTHQTWLSMPLDFKLTWDHGYRPADTEFNVRFGSTHNPTL